MDKMVASLTKQDEVGCVCAEVLNGKRNNVVNVKWHVELILSMEPAPLACRAISVPDKRTCGPPFVAGIERLAMGRDAAKPSRVKFATLIPHRVI